MTLENILAVHLLIYDYKIKKFTYNNKIDILIYWIDDPVYIEHTNDNYDICRSLETSEIVGVYIRG